MIVECVPNFSEGRDAEVIRVVAGEVEKGEGVRLLDVDPGKATNRTVVTFAGEPQAVLDAAVRLARKATELIDMRRRIREVEQGADGAIWLLEDGRNGGNGALLKLTREAGRATKADAG